MADEPKVNVWLGGKKYECIADDTIDETKIKINSKEIQRLIDFNKKKVSP